MNAFEDIAIKVSQVVRARPESVFQAFVDAPSVGRWMFGPHLQNEKVLHTQIDARSGGRFSFLVQRDGRELNHVGQYSEVIAPIYLAFSWGLESEGGDSSRVTISIRAHEEGAQVTLTHFMDPRWASMTAKVSEGWTQMLGSLARYLS